ncbi:MULTISPECIES: chemotaxis protein CheD [Methylovorus]|jgi:chemotaxis protein CheD|uniref:Probable chemoreceptor glutamine deamidase CheD n=1 Tax=Methylovorus glucosotrophus (strain SIP3-4) TaxID=582744 RepID=C6XBH0_METGS|nr:MULTISPECIES: chemotaxis protein CheD [Methylovorus]ACT51940.1 CheD, stimulates methylation of MCP protein [Methylovorus glucosotrophus SIP3-4]ADQ85784.1 CheD, stimulates methylation of MCP protein [Methylovorus sp. MP688]KAF0842782.1 chemotaxis protein CheD [Methylovorus glucosotrophus]
MVVKPEKPPFVIDIFLQPGELYFGDRHTRIRTVLGSCVSVVFWHPEKLLGGMTHIMMPPKLDIPSVHKLDGRYADDAIAMMFEEMKKFKAFDKNYHVKIFGGGNMFPKTAKEFSKTIGCKNIQAVESILKKHGFRCKASHLGGSGHRNISFDVWSGHVWMRHVKM